MNKFLLKIYQNHNLLLLHIKKNILKPSAFALLRPPLCVNQLFKLKPFLFE